MACECRKTIEGKLLANLQKQNPDAKDHSAKMTGYAFFVRDSLTEKGVMPVEFMYSVPTKAGGLRLKRVNSSVTFNFCPCCGVRYEEKQAEGVM